MRKSNNYISFETARKLIREENYRFCQDMAQTWFKLTNGANNYWMNRKVAQQLKQQVINKK
jgi:hypothetical protein